MSQSERDPAGHTDDRSASQVMARAALHATVCATGAAVMVVEILGTRIIGPVFGVSLFVWTALLSVTLCSLAFGYAIGGALVDRTPTPRLMGLVIVASGILLGLSAPASRPVLALAATLGPRVGPLVGAALLFTPSLATLGMIAPIAVRLATRDVRATGHRVGSIYAISTAGSVLGTLLVSFHLISTFETNAILLGTASLLCLTGAVWLPSRARIAALALALAMPAAASFTPARRLPAGLRILERAHSPYGLLEVIDDSERGVRLLRADHSILGAQFAADRSASFDFLHVLEAVRFLRPAARDMLQLGLGIGSLPMALRPFGIEADVVEIDPDVVRLSRRHFGFATRGAVHVEDARTFLQRTGRKYDLIVHDTFAGGATPEHLLSVEVLLRIHALLRRDGVLARTFPGYDRSLLASFQRWEVLQRVPAGPIITDARNPMARLQLPVAENHFDAMAELLPSEVWLP